MTCLRRVLLGWCVLVLCWTGGGPGWAQSRAEVATFAGGCFWCVEAVFDDEPGVISVVSGFMGGQVPNPTYEDVAYQRTGHAEVVQVEFDPQVVSYETLLEWFWQNIDPLDEYGQFCDRGNSYRSEIFFHTPEQHVLAEASRQAIEQRFQKPIATKITPATAFYRAEEYHQQYHKKNPLRYTFYRTACGRDRRLRELWGPS
ncbi:MAG: peptide-methionine (S)-S-oxide reductase MsrA [Synechococcales cyanobacterium]